MRKLVVLTLLAAALGGCAITPGQQAHGNFVQAATLDQQKLAVDAVKQLAVLNPPARTRLELQQPTPDPFGQALLKALRDKGYAVAEFGVAAGAAAAPTPSAPGDAAAMAPTPGLALRYVLDQAGDANLYRLTVTVGGQSLTRAYLAQSGVFAPAGSWARKE